MAKKKNSGGGGGISLLIVLIAAALLIGLVILWQKDKGQDLARVTPAPEKTTPIAAGPDAPAGPAPAPEPRAPESAPNRAIIPAPSAETNTPAETPAAPRSTTLIPSQEELRSAEAPLAATATVYVSHDKAYAGIPRVASGIPVHVLENKAYATGYSEVRKNPLWTAFKLIPEHVGINYKRPREFKTDPRTTARVHDSDFSHSGYDRGHMAPNSPIADCWGQDAQIETFLLSNISPQSKNLNQKVWENMERAEATQYSRAQPVWIICGPLFSDHPATLKGGVQIPERFYRIVIRERASKTEVMAFDVPQDVTGKETPDQFLTSVRAIEKKTSIDFMWELPDEIENQLETQKTHMWTN